MREGVSKEEVIAVAERLLTEGKSPTLRAVRADLGTGSLTTIGNFLNDWRANQTKPEAPMRELAPQLIGDRFNALATDIWSVALSMANDRLKSEREALEALREEMQQQMKETLETADDLAAEVEQLRGLLEVSKANEESLRNMWKSEQDDNIRLQAAAEATEKRIADLVADADRARGQAHAAEQSYNHVSAKFDDQASKHEQEIEQLRNKIYELKDDLSMRIADAGRLFEDANRFSNDRDEAKQDAKASRDALHAVELEKAKMLGELETLRKLSQAPEKKQRSKRVVTPIEGNEV